MIPTSNTMDLLSSNMFQKIFFYFLLYLFGLLGIGNVYIFILFILVCCLVCLKTGSLGEAGVCPASVWWLEDSLVERVGWLNQIVRQFWPHVISVLQQTLEEFPLKNGDFNEKIKYIN